MKSPKEMTDMQLGQWLVKTKNSLSNALRRGNAYTKGGEFTREVENLIDRYEELRQECRYERQELWKYFCGENCLDYGHDAYDYLA